MDDALDSLDLVAPALLWSESTSAINEMRWRGDVDPLVASDWLDRVLELRVRTDHGLDLFRAASDVAVRLGWAKTCDAEYVALAEMLDVPLVTRDNRLRRGASRIVTVLSPDEALA